MTDLNVFLSTPILQPLDQDRAAALLSAPPFVLVPGVVNIRDIGGLALNSNSTDAIPLVVRKGRLYRAATLNDIAPEGKDALRSLNIGAVFDLRTLREVRKSANIAPGDLDPRAGLVDLTSEGELEKDGIEVYHVPLVDSTKQDERQEFAKLLRYGNGDDGFVEAYAEMLESGAQSYGTILRYIVEQAKEGTEGKACLWHCHGEYLLGCNEERSYALSQAGKDRTGVFSALLLEVMSSTMASFTIANIRNCSCWVFLTKP